MKSEHKHYHDCVLYACLAFWLSYVMYSTVRGDVSLSNGEVINHENFGREEVE